MLDTGTAGGEASPRHADSKLKSKKPKHSSLASHNSTAIYDGRRFLGRLIDGGRGRVLVYIAAADGALRQVGKAFPTRRDALAALHDAEAR